MPMLPLAAMPLNDPDGRLFPHLKRITPDLKSLFKKVYLSVTAQTQQNHPFEVAWLKSEPFFKVIYHEEDLIVGDNFLTLFGAAARGAHPLQTIHLCYLDRVAYALQTGHREQFMADISGLRAIEVPLIYERSPAAWETHPRNYFEFENMVTTAGQWLFGRSLDFAWCHIALPAGLLLNILPTIQRRDMAHVAEYVLAVRNYVHVKTVDWLAWEDPFIMEKDPRRTKSRTRKQPRRDLQTPRLCFSHAAAAQHGRRRLDRSRVVGDCQVTT